MTSYRRFEATGTATQPCRRHEISISSLFRVAFFDWIKPHMCPEEVTGATGGYLNYRIMEDSRAFSSMIPFS
jgi:hypothetical protein